jgi:hypothetical protein
MILLFLSICLDLCYPLSEMKEGLLSVATTLIPKISFRVARHSTTYRGQFHQQYTRARLLCQYFCAKRVQT